MCLPNIDQYDHIDIIPNIDLMHSKYFYNASFYHVNFCGKTKLLIFLSIFSLPFWMVCFCHKSVTCALSCANNSEIWFANEILHYEWLHVLINTG